jgi:hypothetical protein
MKQQPKALPWSPEDIFDEMHGMPTGDMHGSILLVEVGDVDRGWVLDFSGKGADADADANAANDSTVISRYDVAGFSQRKNNKKAPSRPSILPDEKLNINKLLPFVWYRDRKVFSKIETGKMSDMAAFVTGKIAASGDSSKWEDIDTIWKEAKEKAQERKKKLQLVNGGSDGLMPIGEQGDDVDDDDDDEEEEIDEEARIIATYKPEVEPMDPRKIEFWKRHFGTDALVASYLFLISSLISIFLTVYFLQVSVAALPMAITPLAHEIALSKIAHKFSYCISTGLFTIASLYFVKLSYPETTMLMAYHAVMTDPNTMTFTERYFTANEMLIAVWLIIFAFALPLCFVILYEVFCLSQVHTAFTDMIIIVIVSLLNGVLGVAAMPDAMRANNGRGSSFFFDYVWSPLFCLKRRDEAKSYWSKHLGNDGMAGGWIMAFFGIAGGIAVIPPVVLHPNSALAWLVFWSTIPFSIGSVLFLRAAYPETMNSSIFFDVSEESSNSDGTGNSSDSGDEVNGENTALLS